MAEPALCEQSDLPAGQCWHCRGDDDSAIPGPQERLGVLSHGSALTELDVAATFTARYPSRCVRCDGPVIPGSTAGWTSDRDLICESCLP